MDIGVRLIGLVFGAVGLYSMYADNNFQKGIMDMLTAIWFVVLNRGIG